MEVVYQTLYFSRMEYVVDFFWNNYDWNILSLTASVWMVPQLGWVTD